MNEQTLLKAIRGLTFAEILRLYRRANPGMDAAKVRRWKLAHPAEVRAQRERAWQRKRQGWARRDYGLPF
jgi:hypothetical protein